MKKTLLGLVFLSLAALVLFQGQFGFPFIGINIWTLLLIAGFSYFSIENFMKRNIIAGFIFAYIALVIANNHYHFLQISSGTLFAASALACIGLSLIFKPKNIWSSGRYWKDRGLSTKEGEIAFGTGTRYIHSDNFTYDKVECAFGSASIYFDNATILGESATFEVDLSFGSVTLYIPSNWRVEIEVDNAFSSVSNPRNVNEKDKVLYLRGEVAFGSLKIVYI